MFLVMIMLREWVYCTITLLATVLARVTEPEPRFVEADITEAPFVASIQKRFHRKKWLHICTGVIIGEEHVLTAASCVFRMGDNSSTLLEPIEPEDLLVMVGTNKIGGGRRIPVSQYCYHIGYKKNQLSDNIAVLILKSQLAQGKKINVAQAPKGFLKHSTMELNWMATQEASCNMYGWNMTATEKDYKGRLLMVQLRLADMKVCSRSYAGVNNTEHACALYDEGDFCDVGSPLVCSDVVWGIHVTSVNCHNDKAFVFYRMDLAMLWKKEAVSSAPTSLPICPLAWCAYTLVFYLLPVM